MLDAALIVALEDMFKILESSDPLIFFGDLRAKILNLIELRLEKKINLSRLKNIEEEKKQKLH